MDIADEPTNCRLRCSERHLTRRGCLDAHLLFDVGCVNAVTFAKFTGGTIENGDFEERTADGKPKFWVYSKDVIPNGSQKALLGSNFVTATANNRIGIGLLATGGQPVTIKFNARAHSE